MSQIVWGQGDRLFDAGLDQAVLYLPEKAVPWNGLVSVQEGDSGEINVEHFFDGRRTHITQVTGEYSAKISAYTYPDEFAAHNGYFQSQDYRRFGLSYRSLHGDTYNLHLVYNALITRDEHSWNTLNDRPVAPLFGWKISAAAEPMPGASPASRLILEANNREVFEAVEDILYGTSTTEPRLPTPSEIVAMYEAATTLKITYNGDGTYTATGPDNVVRLLEDGRFEIEAPTAFELNNERIVVRSY